MAAFSMDLRERVAAACDEGLDTREEVAERFAVSVSWVRHLLQRRRDTGSLQPRPHGGGQPAAFDEAASERLRQAVAQTPDATLQELARLSGVACSLAAVDHALRRLGITRKKSRSEPRSRSGPMSKRPAPPGTPRSL